MLNTLDGIVPDKMNFAQFHGARSHSRLVDAFVDNTSLGFTSPGNMEYIRLIDRLQAIAQTWEHILFYLWRKIESVKMLMVRFILGMGGRPPAS